jgi:outer membrane protein assembly factor BamB
MAAAGIVLAATAGAFAGDTARASDWPMFHGDRRHSGYSINDAPHDSLLAWSLASKDSIVYSSPVVGEYGTIYIGNVEGELLSIAPSGDLRWSFEIEGNFRYSTPAIGSDRTIYIGGSDGRLYAVNPDSTLKWTFATAGPVKTSPTIGADGAIYFGSDDGTLYAINPDSTLRWAYPAGDTIRSSPAIAPDGTVLFGCLDSYFYALWPNGTLRWRAATGAQIKFCSPAVTEDNVVYFGSYDGFLYALTTDQEFLWAHPTGHVIRSSPAIGPEGRIYVGAGSELLCINPDGESEWTYDTDGPIYSSPVYFGDDFVICVGSDDGVFHCVHEDGSGDWTYTVGAPIRSSPGPGPFGRIHVADMQGRIWTFGTNDGSVDEKPHGSAGVHLIAEPNPFSGRVTFRALAGDPSESVIVISDILGRSVTTLHPKSAGTWVWNGRDFRGQPLAGGVYFYRAAGSRSARRITLLR